MFQHSAEDPAVICCFWKSCDISILTQPSPAIAQAPPRRSREPPSLVPNLEAGSLPWEEDSSLSWSCEVRKKYQGHEAGRFDDSFRARNVKGLSLGHDGGRCNLYAGGWLLHRGSHLQRLCWERSPPPVRHGHSGTRVGIWQESHSKALTGQES